MNPLPKHLEEMRDELAEKLANEYFPPHKDFSDRNSIYKFSHKEGFNQTASIMLKDMESMAKALEFYETCHICSRCNPEIKNEALKIWREKYSKQSEGL